MMLQWDRTDRDTASRYDDVWRVTPSHSMPVIAPPPPLRVDLHMNPYEALAGVGGIILVEGIWARPIDQDVHEQLLDESLERYPGIWRSLAEK